MTVETRVEHPLDPLTPQEIEAAAGIVRADPGPAARRGS